MIPHHLIVVAAIRHGDPLLILRLSLASYRLPWAVGISGIQQFGGSFWVEPLFNGVTLLIAIGIAGYAQRRKGATKR